MASSSCLHHKIVQTIERYDNFIVRYITKTVNQIGRSTAIVDKTFIMLYIDFEVNSMIRSNLAILLAERNLKITKVSADTGISRTTLTALCNHYSKGIQFDTLNELCLYLDIAVADLITFIPVDVEITDVAMSPPTGPGHRQLSIITSIREGRREYQIVCLEGFLSECREDKKTKRLEVVIDAPDVDRDNIESLTANECIQRSFPKLPRAFFPELEKALGERLRKLYEGIPLEKDCNITYIWSDDLMWRRDR